AKRGEAVHLADEIEKQGELLSIATEDYNQASVRRARVDGKLARLRRDLDGAERRWTDLKLRLGLRVRYLYMHPGSWAPPWLADEERRRRAEAAARRGGHATRSLPAPHDVGPVRPAAARAIATAEAQLGKPYQWGAEGPDSFDCSGLTMYAWASSGVSLPHSS